MHQPRRVAAQEAGDAAMGGEGDAGTRTVRSSLAITGTAMVTASPALAQEAARTPASSARICISRISG